MSFIHVLSDCIQNTKGNYLVSFYSIIVIVDMCSAFLSS